MRGTRQNADLCLQAPTGCCTVRKQVGAIKLLLKSLKHSLILRFASIRSQSASSCLEWMMVCPRLHQPAAVTGLQMVYQM
jgi:hypothetical protein